MHRFTPLALAALTLVSLGCRPSADAGFLPTGDPKVAATQLESAFAQASPEDRKTAFMAAEALRTKSYEKAVVGLQALKAGPAVSFDQGLAVHNSVIALETELAVAAQSGDSRAREAFRLLKAMKAK